MLGRAQYVNGGYWGRYDGISGVCTSTLRLSRSEKDDILIIYLNFTNMLFSFSHRTG